MLAIGRPLHRRVVRPVTHVAMPYVRFLFDRISPGGLGLELTTLLAIAGVGIFVFVVYLTEIARDPGPTPFDNELLDLADRLHMDVLVDVAKLVTSLGAFPTAATLVVGAAVLLVARKRYAEALVLVVGLALVYVAVDRDQGRPRARAPRRRVRGHQRARLSERPCGLRHRVGGGGGGAHANAPPRDERGARVHRPGDRRRRGDLAGVPASALVVRRGRRLGTGRRDIRACWRR